jgi:hypothetical protein
MVRIRLTQRRQMIARARLSAIAKVKKEITPVFKSQYKRLERFLRRANLKKKLQKIKVPDGMGDPLQAAQFKVSELFKAPSPPASDRDEWETWKKVLIAALLLGMLGAIDDFAEVENNVWVSRGQDPLTYDNQQILDDLQRRIGRDFSDIADATMLAVELIITRWYIADEPFTDLLTKLERYFTDSRINTVADTEAGDALSQVIFQAMTSYGVSEWYWDHFGEDDPCTNPIVILGRTYEGCNELNGKTFRLGDPMPPDAAHPNCHCLPTPVGL